MPQDIVKTKQQTHPGPDFLRGKDVLRDLYREGGIRRIFKGSGPTFARGYLTNMVTLPLFDAIHSRLESSKSDE